MKKLLLFLLKRQGFTEQVLATLIDACHDAAWYSQDHQEMYDAYMHAAQLLKQLTEVKQQTVLLKEQKQ